METLVKQTREVGTSAGVLLPRKWLNKQVVVTLLSPSTEKIAKDVLDILINEGLNEEVKGIYLFGSYARGDSDFNSDVDVLVITEKTNKLINKDNYEITMIPEDSFSRNLSNSLHNQIMLKEIKVVINKELIERYVNKKYKLNIKKPLKEIGEMVKINKESVDMYKELEENVPDGIVYSIVLRLRELYIMKCLLSNKSYSKKNFIKIIGERTYSAHSRIKRNIKELDNISPKEVKPLLDLSEKWLKELKG